MYSFYKQNSKCLLYGAADLWDSTVAGESLIFLLSLLLCKRVRRVFDIEVGN